MERDSHFDWLRADSIPIPVPVPIADPIVETEQRT